MVIASLPQISISLAPPEDPLVEPYSPFACDVCNIDDDDSFRPKLLTPPPTNARFVRQLSPLRPVDTRPGQGLERERFEALLRASRERNAVTGAKKTTDLRKEVALKAHKNKQVERRALFLSKVLAPPSPTATSLPKTPPDSPAIFHYTLPSPGLVSPLALFESLTEVSPTGTTPLSSCEPWVEQVDFRRPAQKHSQAPIREVKSARLSSLPSLDQISARLNTNAHFSSAPSAYRLSGLIKSASSERPRLPLAVGRLQMPVRSNPERQTGVPPPSSPCSTLMPQLQVTTLVVPRSSTLSPTELSESNLHALDSRERRAQDMLSTLRRRMLPSDHGLSGHEDSDDRRTRRHSAPADLHPHRPRTGFEHPVLSMPGGF